MYGLIIPGIFLMTNKDIVKSKESGKLFLSRELMLGYGCKNCVWKSYNQCPHGLTEPDESLDKGYCMELADFIFSLAENEDKISAVKEKFHLYTQEMQSLSDHSEFHKALTNYKLRKAEGASKEELAKLHMTVLSYRLWWEGLSNSVVKSLARIADREQKKDNKIEIDHKISLTQIHQLANDAQKQLEENDE